MFNGLSSGTIGEIFLKTTCDEKSHIFENLNLINELAVFIIYHFL